MLIKNNFRHVNKCRLCNSNKLSTLIDFGKVPLGNNLLKDKKSAIDADEYPLEVMCCEDCNHYQLNCAVDPNILYATNYTYLSGVGLSFLKHIKSYVQWVEDRTTISRSSIIVDIGSNDGTCLESFKQKGYQVCGVDPAKLAANISKKKGIYTINSFFNDEVYEEIINKFGKVDLITSQNVLAHVDDIQYTFSKIYDLLKDNGYFVFEVGYFKNVLELGTFDTIYHEHLDYHHALPLVKHLCSIGFEVTDIESNNIQGGSIRMLLKKNGTGFISEKAKEFLFEEKKSVIFDNNFLTQWGEKIFANCSEIRRIIKKEKENDVLCYAYGAPTKATLLLKMTKLTSDDIDFVVEDNEHKVGKFLPKSDLLIKSIDHLNFNKKSTIIILAWNFSEDIVNKLKKLYKVPIRVVIPIPQLKVFDL